jgi:glycosyltransferase involved in cell wall biosynthesis
MTEPAARRMKLSIIIPTFNEEPTIQQLIERLLATPFSVDVELVVVDDRSTDHTFAIERALGRQAGRVKMKVLRNRTNKGKGACIRQGLKHVTGELVVVQDGDLEYDPRDLARLVEPLAGGRTDLVMIGSRFRRRAWPYGMAPANMLANRALTGLTNLLFGLRLTDMESCYKMMPSVLMRQVKVCANRFEAEPELVAKLARLGVSFQELPIGYEGRSYQEGKKIRASDFFVAVATLLRYRFAPPIDRSGINA